MAQATAEPGTREGNPHLKRTLGTMAIVGLGLGYMTPTVIFDTFGIVWRRRTSWCPWPICWR